MTALTAIVYSESAVRDLQRLGDFLHESDPQAGRHTAETIVEALAISERHPLIGRPIAVNRRELVIFRGRTGYLAQYSFTFARDEVVILSVRHQREVDA